MLEAVAAAPAPDELLLDGGQRDAGMLLQQHVDVVEGEGAQVRFVHPVQQRAARCLRRDADPTEVAVEVELVDLPEVVGHVPIVGFSS